MNSLDPGAHPSGWIEVTILAPPPQAEAAADFLVRLTGRGVETMPGPGGREQVKAFLEEGPRAGEQRRQVAELVRRLAALAPGEVSVEFRALPDQDWGESWKRHFHPQELAPGLWVAPPWEPPPGQVPEGEVVLIDPGQAFGTGQHASTLLCLQHLARLAGEGRLPGRLLDLGCGTGILALAGLRLGVERALALDLDPLALAAARHNAELNGLASRLEISSRPLEQMTEEFPLILANLTALDLVQLAPGLAARLELGGELVASGILEGQDARVRQALEGAGLGFVERGALGEWCSLVMVR